MRRSSGSDEASAAMASTLCHAKMHARTLLQITDHAEQIFGLRVAARPKHADQAFRRCAGRGPELLEADRCLDVVAQDRLAGIHVARKQGVDALAQERLRKFYVTLDVVLHQFLEALRPCHFRLRQRKVRLSCLYFRQFAIAASMSACWRLFVPPASRIIKVSPSRPK